MQSIKPVDIISKTTGRVIGRRYELGVPSEKGGVLIQEVHDVNGKTYFRGRGERNVRERQTPYTEILGEIPPMEKSTGEPKDDDYMRRPGENITISADLNGRGKVYFLEGKTVDQLKREEFNNPSSRTKLPTGDKLSRPGRYNAPSGTPKVPIDFNIKWGLR
jgi:hypothetical protein